jgi:thiol-disulfide isomerase/thioredoxin
MRARVMIIAAVSALAVAACASPSAIPTKEAASSDSAAAAALSVAPSGWANPEAPDALKFRTTDLMTGDTIDGTTLMYEDVVLWFWASWCPVCAAESGALVEAAKEFPDGVKVIGIAGYSDVPSSRGFIEEHGIDGFPNIYDEDGSIWKAFNITGQPTLVLVNQDGQLRRYAGGYGKFDLIEKVAWLGDA